MARRKGEVLDTLKEVDAALKVLYWFFAYPTREIGLNDLSEAVGIAKKTAQTVIPQLRDADYLHVERLGRLWRITANPSLRYFQMKIAFNLQAVYLSGLVERIHHAYPQSRAVILFGSHRKGDDTDESDIDIAIEVLGEQEIKIQEFGTIQVGYRKQVAVNLQIFTRSHVDVNLFANIANGIVLDGFLEVVP